MNFDDFERFTVCGKLQLRIDAMLQIFSDEILWIWIKPDALLSLKTSIVGG